jgi:hypothetical protein
MRKWLYDRPWIWVVLFLATLIGASVATVIIAEVNKPEIVKPKAGRKTAATSLLAAPGSRGLEAGIGIR